MFKPVNTGLHAVSKSSKRYLTIKIRLKLEKKNPNFNRILWSIQKNKI